MNVCLNVILGFSQFDRLKAIFVFPNNFHRFKPYFVIQGLRYGRLFDCVDTIIFLLAIDDIKLLFYPFTEPTLPSTIKQTTPETRLAENYPQSDNGMIPVK